MSDYNLEKKKTDSLFDQKKSNGGKIFCGSIAVASSLSDLSIVYQKMQGYNIYSQWHPISYRTTHKNVSLLDKKFIQNLVQIVTYVNCNKNL